MDTHTWCIGLGVIMAIGMVLIIRYAPRWFRREPPADMLAWMGEVERAFTEMVRDDMIAVQSKARLFNLIGELPRDFDPTAFLASNAAAGLQRAVLIQAEQEGLVPEGMFARIYGEPVDVKRTQATKSEPLATLSTLHLVADDDEAEARWVGNQLIPKSRRKL